MDLAGAMCDGSLMKAGGSQMTQQPQASAELPPRSTVASTPHQRSRRSGISTRLRLRWRRDARLFAGIALACVGGALAWILWPANNAGATPALVALRDLPAGLVVDASDVAVANVDVPRATAELLVQVAAGQRLTRTVAAGALLTDADVQVSGIRRDEVRLVSINVEPGHAPPDARRGDEVEIWATPDHALSAVDSRLVARVVIADVSAADTSLGDRVFVMQMSASQSPRVISALRNHAIDLVEVSR